MRWWEAQRDAIRDEVMVRGFNPAIGSYTRTYAPARDEYWLTDMGRELYPALEALLSWGERYMKQAYAVRAGIDAADLVDAGHP